MAHNRLRIELLGNPRVFNGDSPLTISRRRVRAILYYLAAERRPVSRITLAGMLWPGKEPAVANRNLSIHVSYLRNAVGENAIDATQNSLAIGRAVESDIEEFFALSAAGGSDEAIAAHRLFRGKFLENFSLRDAAPFEQWVELERVRWAKRRCAATLDTALILEGRGIYDTALSLTEEIIDENPTREDLCRHGMRIAPKAQLPDKVERLFAKLSAALDEQYGTAPTLETVQCYRDALGVSRPVIAPVARRNIFEKSDAPFVGRTEQFQALLSLPKGFVGLAFGGSGMGKTRLMNEIAKNLDGRRFYISFTKQGQTAPFSAIAETLRVAEQSQRWIRTRNRVVAKLSEADVSRISLIMRSFHAHRLDEVPSSPVSLGEIAESLERFFALLASERPLHFLVDDVQFADNATLQLLENLIMHDVLRASTCIMTISTDVERPEAAQFFNRLEYAKRLEAVELDALPLECVTDVIMRYYPSLPKETALQLAIPTKGVPFWMKGVIRNIDLGHSSFGLGNTAEGLLDATISSLSPEALDVMLLLSAADMPLETRLLDVLARAGAAKTAIDELVALGLVRNDACGKVSLSNKQMRDAVLAKTSCENRATAHLRIARAMEATYGEASAGVQDLIACDQYSQSDHPAECGPFAARAADYLMTIGDEAGAIRYLAQAQRYLHEAPALDASLALFTCLANAKRPFEAQCVVRKAISAAENHAYLGYAGVLKAAEATLHSTVFAALREGSDIEGLAIEKRVASRIAEAFETIERDKISPLAHAYMKSLGAVLYAAQGNVGAALDLLDSGETDEYLANACLGVGLFARTESLRTLLESMRESHSMHRGI